jgi:hypothetical protein
MHSSMIWMRLLLTTACGARSLRRLVTLLAEAYDKKIFRQIAKAAREAHPITAAPGPEPGGSVIQLGANKEFDAQALGGCLL